MSYRALRAIFWFLYDYYTSFGNQVLLKLANRIPTKSKIVEQIGKCDISHLERILPVQNREKAFLIEIIDLIDVNEAIGAKNHCV